MPSKRCLEYVVDKKSKRVRKCLKPRLESGYCSQHSKDYYGRCCFCHEFCNINSQACGRCCRNILVYLD